MSHQRTTAILLGLLAAVILHAAYVLMIGLTQPITGMHEFRQTQTALSAYWIWKEGHYLAYETPVVGYPWSIPFEFPVYEYCVAALLYLGVPIEVGGRLVSFAFYIGFLWPLAVLFKSIRLGKSIYLTTSIILLCSPIYLFWARTVMIETCAVFFALGWLAFLARFIDRGDTRDVVVASLLGCIATTAKSTTFPPFGALGAVLICWTLWQHRRRGPRQLGLRILLPTAIATVVPLAAGLLWVWFSDHVKEANTIGAYLTSAALEGWNFGTWSQRWSDQLWRTVILWRTIPDCLGYGAIVAPFLIGSTLTSKKMSCLSGLAVVAFLFPFLLLSNLHIFHNYYQTANAVFLLAAVGLGIGTIIEAGGQVRAIVALVTVIGGQLTFFHRTFAPIVTADYTSSPSLVLGTAIKKLTRPGQAIVIFGDDWSSALPFYSERKSLMVPYFLPAKTISDVVAGISDHIGPDAIGAVVACPTTLRNYLGNEAGIRAFINGRQILGEAAGCQILAPAKS